MDKLDPTGGSLLLGFYIMLRDRRRAEEQDARRVILEVTKDDGGEILFALHNVSDRSVYAVGFYSTQAGLVEAAPTTTLLPGQKTAPWRSSEIFETERAGITFTDADGTRWARPLITHKLLRVGGFPRTGPARLLLHRGHRRLLAEFYR